MNDITETIQSIRRVDANGQDEITLPTTEAVALCDALEACHAAKSRKGKSGRRAAYKRPLTVKENNARRKRYLPALERDGSVVIASEFEARSLVAASFSDALRRRFPNGLSIEPTDNGWRVFVPEAKQ